MYSPSFLWKNFFFVEVFLLDDEEADDLLLCRDEWFDWRVSPVRTRTNERNK